MKTTCVGRQKTKQSVEEEAYQERCGHEVISRVHGAGCPKALAFVEQAFG